MSTTIARGGLTKKQQSSGKKTRYSKQSSTMAIPRFKVKDIIEDPAIG
jgi:hypothetical protein